MRSRLDARTAIAVTITILSWASAYAGIRVALAAYSPTHLALLRYGVASLALGLYAIAVRLPLPKARDLPGLLLLGGIGIAFYNVALSYGEVSVPAATASFLIASSPIWISFAAAAFLGERLHVVGWVGIAASFLGVAVIALGTSVGLRLDPNALLVLAAAMAHSIYSIGQKPYLAKYSAMQCTAFAIWAGTLLLLPLGKGLVSEIAAAPLRSTLAVVYIGLVPGAIGYLTWSYVLSRIPAPRAGSFLYLIPAVALAIGWVWLGEVPTGLSIMGGLLVVVGVILINGVKRKSLVMAH
jgi:drug/metabolite transporter (DMT)-like permease